MKPRISTVRSGLLLVACLSTICLLPSEETWAEDASPVPRLPGAGTFDRLEKKLSDLGAAEFAEKARQDLAAATRLLRQGRLQFAAGRLRRAGSDVEQCERTITLIELRMKNASLQNELRMLKQDETALSRRITALTSRLQNASNPADEQPAPPEQRSEETEAP